LNITDILTEHAARRPDHPAIEDGDRVLTYAELDRRVDDAAANLQSLGIAPGDFVGVMLPDSTEHLVTLLALARAGAVMVAIDDALSASEQRRATEHADLKAVIAAAESPALGDARIVPVATICRSCPAPFERRPLDADHPLVMSQSSGTTGAPKSFLWSHHRMWLQVPRMQRCFGLAGQDRYLALVKMAFFWERKLCLTMFCLGGTVVVNRAQTLTDLVARIRNNRITLLTLTPAHVRFLLDHPAEPEPLFPLVRAMIVGSAPTTHERRLLVRRRLTPNFYEQLGTNEAGPLIVGRPADHDARPGAIGRAADGLEAQVLGEDGRPLPPGEVGLLGFRGAGLPAEYIGNPEANRRAFRDGWYYPGDLAAIDAEGFIFFKGRADDVINFEGVKFYPIEIERALLAHPAIAEAAVFGWPHSRRGEVAVAFVVATTSLTVEELQAFCRQHMAAYKVPPWFGFVDKMPKNAAGKIMKTRLKEIFRDWQAKAGGTAQGQVLS
jgi:acyl-CoA synthetase (AMP-forming)/AMP-acid ligase II